MVGLGAVGQPRAPERARARDVLPGLLGCARSTEPLGPGERAKALLALIHRVATVYAVALDAHARVAEEAKAGIAAGPAERVAAMLVALGDGPFGRGRSVVEHRLAHHLQLHLALDALDDPDEQMIGVVVGRRAGVTRAPPIFAP